MVRRTRRIAGGFGLENVFAAPRVLLGSVRQAKLLKSYKRLTYAYEAFDDRSLPASLERVAEEESLATLRVWSAAARTKWLLARRVIVARAEHHQQFYAGGDWGHAKYVSTVCVHPFSPPLRLESGGSSLWLTHCQPAGLSLSRTWNRCFASSNSALTS